MWENHLARFKRKKEVNENAVIGGKVCRIDQAEEPSDIIWENMDTTLFERYFGFFRPRPRFDIVSGGMRKIGRNAGWEKNWLYGGSHAGPLG